MVDIETEWNLKVKTVEHVHRRRWSRYRNRVEFKVISVLGM